MVETGGTGAAPGKQLYVAELQEGCRVDDLFLVKSVKTGETRAGKTYLVVTVQDRSGEVSGPVWDRVSEMQALCIAGEVVRVSGTVQSCRDVGLDEAEAATPRPTGALPSCGRQAALF